MIALPDAGAVFALLCVRRGRAREGLLTADEVREFLEGVALTIGRLRPDAPGDVSAVVGRRWGQGMSRHVDLVEFVGGSVAVKRRARNGYGATTSQAFPFCRVEPSRVLDPPALRDHLRASGFETRGGAWWPPQ